MAAVAVAEAARKRRRETEFFIIIKWVRVQSNLLPAGCNLRIATVAGQFTMLLQAKNDHNEIYNHC